jgi:hypothetical protein
MTKRKWTNNDQQDNAQTTKDQARRIQTNKNKGPSWLWSYGSWIYYLCNQCLSPMMLWVRISIRARCTTLCDKVCQWLATDRWFPPVSSTNKTYRHDITEILLKVALNTIKQTKKRKGKQFLLQMWHSVLSILFQIVISINGTYPWSFVT